jgi:tRNA(fMet)-specific endonuclease VapC
MTYLIDTDQIVSFLSGRAETHSLLTHLWSDGLAISLISYGETYEGIYYGRESRKHELTFQTFLRGVDVLPLNRRIMRRFARLRGDLRARGLAVADADLLIASTAIEHGLTLVTSNLRHFQRIPGLSLY